MIASASSWKKIPFTDGLPLPFSAEFNNSEFSLLQKGIIPNQMEDKWFIYYHSPHLFFHRSWTGKAVYRITLKDTSNKVVVSEVLWATEFATANHSDLDYEAKLVDFLISNLLLKQDKPFPLSMEIKYAVPGVFQHHFSGTGYREVFI